VEKVKTKIEKIVLDENGNIIALTGRFEKDIRIVMGLDVV